MNPLMTLWLIVFGATVILSGFFYLAENYAHIIGNFYVILGVLVGGYALFSIVRRILKKNREKPSL